jgi:hypothetical protein
MRPAYEWDHIDPDYPEDCDRPYQMVCGFTNESNLVERDHSLNASKGNRFLPWKVSQGEIGSVPVNPGDLCQFLDRATGDWILEEFMGDWWFAQTKDLCGAYYKGVSDRDNRTGLFDPNNWQNVLDGCAKENARRMKPIVVIDPQGKKHNHKSLNGAARHHGLSAGNLCGVLNGTRNHTKNYTAYYL